MNEILYDSSGVGRTGTLIVIDTMLDRAEDGELIDIYHCVATLRTRRQNMVQTEVCQFHLIFINFLYLINMRRLSMCSSMMCYRKHFSVAAQR